MAFWILKDSAGAHRHQVITKGSEEPWRDMPGEPGWSFIRVPRHSHDPRERFDETTRRWKSCPVLSAEHETRERAAAVAQATQLSDAVIEALADRVAAKLEERREKP